MRFLELTARRIGSRMILTGLELDWLRIYAEGRSGITAEMKEAAYNTLDAMHYSEPVYSFGERLKIVFVGPIELLIGKIFIKICRAVVGCKAEEA